MRCALPASLFAVTVALAPVLPAAQSGWHALALGRIILDAPSDWIAARDDRGGWIIEEPRLRRWTLRVDSEQVEAGGGAGAARVDALAERLRDQLLDRWGGTIEVTDLDVAEKLLVHDHPAEPGRQARDWHRIALGDVAIVIAHFSHVVAADSAAGREMAATRQFIERAVMGAELNPLAPPYRPSGPRLVDTAPGPP